MDEAFGQPAYDLAVLPISASVPRTLRYANSTSSAPTSRLYARAAKGLYHTEVSRPGPHFLLVSKRGAGGGEISSDGSGIDCGQDCTERHPTGTQIVLQATPAVGSVVAGWGGVCSGTGPRTPTLDGGKRVTDS